MGGTDTPAPGVRLDAAEFGRRAEQLRAGWLADPDLTAADVAALMQPYESFALMMAENEEEDRMGEEQPAGAAPSMGDEREQLAEYAHEAWSGWMQYLFAKATRYSDGTYHLEREQVERWTRQMNTPYAELPEQEKESDRVEADRMLAIVTAARTDATVPTRRYPEMSRDARDRALLELLERVATATYSGANEALLLVAKGRALDRLIAAWERLDADAARPPAGQGEG